MKPDGPVARRAEYALEPVTHGSARALIGAFHYAGGAANTSVHAHGMFLLRNMTMKGAVLWMPPTANAAKSLALRHLGTADRHREALTLSRCALIPEQPKNLYVTYADEGEGHVGTIYKAAGWAFDGRTKPETRWHDRDGRLVSKVDALAHRRRDARARLHPDEVNQASFRLCAVGVLAPSRLRRPRRSSGGGVTAIGFIVHGRPHTWQRPPEAGRGRFDARGKAAKEYAELVAGHARQALQQLKLAGIAWPDVKSHKPRFRVDVAGWWPDGNEGDADRLLSLVYDALQGVAFKSDRQVKVSALSLGEPCDEPQLAVFVEVIDGEDRGVAASETLRLVADARYVASKRRGAA